MTERKVTTSVWQTWVFLSRTAKSARRFLISNTALGDRTTLSQDTIRSLMRISCARFEDDKSPNT